MTAALPPSERDTLIAEVERELRLRQRNYPIWVEQHKLAPQAAERRLAIMLAILDLVRLHPSHTPSPDVRIFEMVEEVEAEIGRRIEHYPRWIALGRIERDEANRRIAAFNALRTWLKSLPDDAPDRDIQIDLFGD